MAIPQIRDLFDSLGELRELRNQCRRRFLLQAIVRVSLPEGLKPHVSVAALDNGRLILAANDGAAAAKLRHLAPRLLEIVRQRAPEVSAIQIRVQATLIGNPLRQKQIFLSPKARAALENLAQNLPPSGLREALMRFATRLSTSSRNEQDSFTSQKTH